MMRMPTNNDRAKRPLWAVFILAVVCTLMIVSCGGGGVDTNAQVDRPATLRTDIKFGYFASVPGQAEEVAAHTNIFMDGGFTSPELSAQSILAADKPTLLSVQQYLFSTVGGASVLRPDARDRLRGYLSTLRALGALRRVVGLYPHDEPEIYGLTEPQFVEAVNLCREVGREYGVESVIATIYTSAGPWIGIGAVDWAGFDDYSKGSAIFFNGQYARFKAALRPTQRIILVPGMADPWRADVTAFVNMAHSDQQVIWVMPFVWFDGAENTGKGIKSNGLAMASCNAGRSLIGVSGAC
jgi:hypothetical protein